MSIFNYLDYREFIKAYLASQPKKGHGLLSKWAKQLQVSTTMLSQIVVGKKALSMDVAFRLAKILALNSKELDYLILLVEFERAGTTEAQNYFRKKLTEAQADSRLYKNRIENAAELSSEAKANYYASWIFSGLRNIFACETAITLEELAIRVKLSRQTVVEAIQFLEKHSLIIPDKQGWKIGPQSTYVSSDSPLARKHHQNWRIKSIQRMDDSNEENLFYTSPMSLSEPVAKEVRKYLVDVIKAIRDQAGPSPSETVRCLNIDWFDY